MQTKKSLPIVDVLVAQETHLGEVQHDDQQQSVSKRSEGGKSPGRSHRKRG